MASAATAIVRHKAPIVHGMNRELLRAAFRGYFGVGDGHAETLLILFERPDRAIGVRELKLLLDSHRGPSKSMIYERIRVLREAMEAESIDSECATTGGWRGPAAYRLTEVGMAECRKALVCMGRALVGIVPDEALIVDFRPPRRAEP